MSPTHPERDFSPQRAEAFLTRYRRELILGAILVLGTILLFWPVRTFDFVNYDDPEYVTDNPMVQQGVTGAGLAWAWHTSHASNWHPLTWVSHMIDCQLFALDPAGHHFTNVLFHAANALLLFLLLKKMTGALWRSFFVALIFAVHPQHVESVAWVSERKDVLSAFFFMLTVMAYVAYVNGRAGEKAGKGEGGNLFSRAPLLPFSLSLVFFALGLMSKPIVVTLPFVLLLLDFWPLKRGVAFRKLVIEKIPFFALTLAACVMTFLYQSKEGAVSSLQSLSVSDRVMNALVAYQHYLAKTIWPAQLCALYPHPGQWPFATVAVSAVVLFAISAAVIQFGRRFPYLAVGWCWFLGTLVPAIGLVQVGIQSAADRYTYLSMTGLLIIVAWGVSDLVARWNLPKAAAAAAGLMATGACVVVTLGQLPFWKNSVALYERVLMVAAQNPVARQAMSTRAPFADVRNNFGHALADAGRLTDAIPQYEMGLKLNPNQTELHDNLGNALAQMGKFDEAIAHFETALRIDPKSAGLQTDYGIALAMSGKLPEAEARLKEAVRLDPNYANAHANLGNAYAVQHKLEQAVPEYEAALRLKPYSAQAHNNLANALGELHRMDESIAHYKMAMELQPDDPNAHFNLGLALMTQGRRDEAIAQYREALRVKPDYAPAQQQLSLLGIK